MSLDSAHKTKVLCVDNDPAVRRLIQKSLEAQGYQVDTAADGAEAMAKMSHGGYDAMLIDQNMPGMTGIEFIQIVSPGEKFFPLIMVTGSGDEATAVKALKLGASEYVVKDVACGFLQLLPPVIERAIKQVRRERERRDLLLALERSNRDLESYAYMVSHDLQTPLRKITHFANTVLMHETNVGEQGRDYLQRIANSAAKMQELVDSLLRYSKLSGGKMNFATVDLQDVLREALADFEISVVECQAKISAQNLPVLEAEPEQMKHLFQNLIGNALKYCQDDVPPSIHLEGGKREDGRWEIRVTDNGIGFDEKYLDRIFLPFERLHGQNYYSGTGIGLAICKRIVERHGGSITAKSKIGEGSTFIVTLPEKQAPAVC